MHKKQLFTTLILMGWTKGAKPTVLISPKNWDNGRCKLTNVYGTFYQFVGTADYPSNAISATEVLRLVNSMANTVNKIK